MRTRHNNKSLRMTSRGAGSTLARWTNCSGAVNTATYNYGAISSAVSQARLERMTDSLGKGSVNPCVHRVHSYDIVDNLASVLFSDTANGKIADYPIPNAWYENNSGIYSGFGAWSVDSDVGAPPGWTIGTSVNEDQLKQAVISRAKGLKADALLNIVEANQIYPAINSLAKSLPYMAAHWWELRKVIRTASAAFLAWKFGVGPILQDIMQINRYLPRMKADVQRHADGDKSRYSIAVQLPTTFADGIYYAGTYGAYTITKYSRQGRMLKSPEVRYVLVVKPNVKYGTSFFQKADTVMSRFTSSPASLAWELVPFSFVLDWFVDIRGALRAIDRMIGSEPYQTVSFTRSLSYELASDFHLETLSLCNGSSLSKFRQCSCEYKHYERIPVAAGGLMPTWQPRFGKSQAAISAALITQALLKIPGAMRF